MSRIRGISTLDFKKFSLARDLGVAVVLMSLIFLETTHKSDYWFGV